MSTGPGSGLGHSLPNLQAIPRYPSGMDHGRGSQLWLSSQLANKPRVLSHGSSLASNDVTHMEVQQSPYSSQTISDGIEEEDESDVTAAAQHQARWKQLALVQAQAQMLSMGYGAHQLKVNSVVPPSSSSAGPPSTSPEAQNNLLSPRGVGGGLSASLTSAQMERQLKVHRPLRQSLSAPGLSLSNGVALHQQPQNQELLQQQHMEFMKQQRVQQQNQARLIQQLQQEFILQQIGAKNLQMNLQKLQELQQQQLLHKESQAVLKEHLEHVQQKEAWKEHFYQLQQQQQQQQQQQASRKSPVIAGANSLQLGSHSHQGPTAAATMGALGMPAGAHLGMITENPAAAAAAAAALASAQQQQQQHHGLGVKNIAADHSHPSLHGHTHGHASHGQPGPGGAPMSPASTTSENNPPSVHNFAAWSYHHSQQPVIIGGQEAYPGLSLHQAMQANTPTSQNQAFYKTF